MKKRTKLIAVYLFIVATVAVIAYSMAAYTSLSSAKRVVTVRGSEQYFTSDILVQYENASSLQSRVKSFGKNDNTRTFSVTVSNHLQNDVTKYDSKSINYTFTAEMVDADGNPVTNAGVDSKLTINYGNRSAALTNGKCEITDKSFAGGTAQDTTYKFILAGDEILQYRIRITAVPTNRSEYKPLGCLIVLAVDSTVSNWTGSFLTTESSAVNNEKTLGLLNYRISGHLEEDCVLSWDFSRVEIDEWFLKQMGISTDQITKTKNGNTKSVKLHLGAAGTPQQYTLQFYRTYAAGDLKEENWDTISNYIKFENSTNSGSKGE